jgi:hypothetical protein
MNRYETVNTSSNQFDILDGHTDVPVKDVTLDKK